jgi:polyisoprenyl-teichoic acid--peptidoglycan teichoic acid transferase
MDPHIPRLARSMWKRFAIAAALIVGMSAAATATAALLQVKNIADALKKGTHLNLGADTLTRAEVGGPQTIMVLGSDHRSIYGKNVRGNSDTMMLIRLDPDKAATSIMSIPRDLKVPITYRGVTNVAKINSAYNRGGPGLAARTVQNALDLPGGINHVIDMDFGGFRHAVDRVGCIYTDVDRRYFNDNSGPGEPYAQINLQPGYQKLCNYDALGYVRYRHEDTDLVRAARQQDFIRQAKDQLSASRLFDDREALAKILGAYTSTDIRGTTQVLELIKLALFSAGHPIREVHFRSEVGPSFVYATPGDIRANVNEFMSGEGSAGQRAPSQSTNAQKAAARSRPRGKFVAGGLEDARSTGEEQAIASQNRAGFPFYYPTLRLRGSIYTGEPRVYFLRDQKGRRHRAYRMVLDTGRIGEFYGIQGLTWRNPPILSKPTGRMTINGRRLLLFADGNRLRIVAYVTPRAVYWVSNTLVLGLTNRQMLAIAASLRPVGR